ncbi:PREDICTED: calmodulin-like protein 6 [Myotis brandtii]|uniref:calmodulin-like protein 6 n=1 Tax=Myotis brandtii TaxID=109478 RepID=UPI000703E234|nr:PREDICTED: calmodulin-like protein 6 [Myotis brandtii]
MAERLTAEQIKEYKGVFEMFDEEGNGQVKTAELERLMSLLGINPTKSELASMAKDVDRDSEAARAGPGAAAATQGWGFGGPCRYVLTNAGEPLNEVEAEQMMKEADKDGDGTIDYEEFVAMMTGESFKLVQ